MDIVLNDGVDVRWNMVEESVFGGVERLRLSSRHRSIGTFESSDSNPKAWMQEARASRVHA